MDFAAIQKLAVEAGMKNSIPVQVFENLAKGGVIASGVRNENMDKIVEMMMHLRGQGAAVGSPAASVTVARDAAMDGGAVLNFFVKEPEKVEEKKLEAAKERLVETTAAVKDRTV